MKQYHNLLRTILEKGEKKSDRTGTGTISIFGHQMRFDLNEGFPCITTKKLHLKSIIHELLWFLNGDNNVKYLNDNGVRIWDEWADKDGNLGPVYGVQWRRWEGKDGDTHDQIKKLLDDLKNNPHSRRHIISAWNVPFIDSMALPPCHTIFQFYVLNGKLSCQLYQRSADVFLGVPFNIASYAFLTCILAKITGYKPGKLIHILGDTHIYESHIEAVKSQIKRIPYAFPQLTISDDLIDIDNISEEYFKIQNYNCHEKISAPMIA